MALSVKNFRGDTYFLHSRLTKKGNLSFHFSKKAEGAADIQNVPEGYEIYEEPNGKVYLRKQTISPIKADELRLIEEGMKKYSIIEDFSSGDRYLPKNLVSQDGFTKSGVKTLHSFFIGEPWGLTPWPSRIRPHGFFMGI
ncbi:hypothetical protein LCM00_15195 [Bacillus infantis]|uniref:hypothetical protein n=1 Tax=Bacillus infantis TaxID=324767 RepID=UPI001CD41A02|nr:hypothetical protein [Bacillus infantis]MCA1040860.1 hypothetical protein [Bacillus infantis]